jgi:hypothetical protein
MMNGGTFSLDEQFFNTGGVEGMAADFHPVVGCREKIVYDGIGSIVTFPLPGSFGRHYGWRDDLRDAIRRNHRGLIDPNRRYLERRKTSPFLYSMTTEMEQRLGDLARSLRRVKAASVLCGITPIPEGRDNEASRQSRDAVASRYLSALQLPRSQFLPTPESMPDSQFATSTHLSPEGRREFTKRLAEALVR